MQLEVSIHDAEHLGHAAIIMQAISDLGDEFYSVSDAEKQRKTMIAALDAMKPVIDAIQTSLKECDEYLARKASR